MSERFVRKQVIRSGTPNIRFEECQNEQQEIEPKLKRTTNPADFLPGWSELLQQAGLDVQLELNISEDLTEKVEKE